LSPLKSYKIHEVISNILKSQDIEIQITNFNNLLTS